MIANDQFLLLAMLETQELNLLSGLEQLENQAKY